MFFFQWSQNIWRCTKNKKYKIVTVKSPDTYCSLAKLPDPNRVVMWPKLDDHVRDVTVPGTKVSPKSIFTFTLVPSSNHRFQTFLEASSRPPGRDRVGSFPGDGGDFHRIHLFISKGIKLELFSLVCFRYWYWYHNYYNYFYFRYHHYYSYYHRCRGYIINIRVI